MNLKYSKASFVNGKVLPSINAETFGQKCFRLRILQSCVEDFIKDKKELGLK